MVVPTRHGNSRAVPTPRANKSSHVAGSAPFLADTVGQSHSLNDATNMNPKRNTHGEHWSPCVFRRPGHEEQYPDLLPCPTDDARTAEKPVGRAPKKGYARHPLIPSPPASAYSTRAFVVPFTTFSFSARRKKHAVAGMRKALPRRPQAFHARSIEQAAV